MEEALALFGRRMFGNDFTADVTDEVQPVSDAFIQAFVNFLAEPLGHCRAFSGGGDGDLEIAAANESGKIKIAVGRIVHGIAEDAQALGFEEHGAVDRVVGGGGDSGLPVELSSGGELFHVGVGGGCDDGDAGAGF